MVSDAGGKAGYVCRSRWKVYRALRREGKSKPVAAAIANEGCSRLGRRRMARKAATTRKRRGR